MTNITLKLNTLALNWHNQNSSITTVENCYYSEGVVNSEIINLVICDRNGYFIISLALHTSTYRPIKTELCDKLLIPSTVSSILWYYCM